jgi:hypothetical protein
MTFKTDWLKLVSFVQSVFLELRAGAVCLQCVYIWILDWKDSLPAAILKPEGESAGCGPSGVRFRALPEHSRLIISGPVATLINTGSLAHISRRGWRLLSRVKLPR